jgi:hypothetical protein
MVMKCFYLVLFFALLSSCIDSNNFVTREEFNKLDGSLDLDGEVCVPKQEMWICHNPRSSFHDKECTDQCYVTGENTRFCWYFHRSNCINKEALQDWQRKYCPKLNNCD